MTSPDWRNRILARMTDLDLTAAELNRRCGFGGTYIHDMLKRGAAPSVERAIVIAQQLHTDLNYLFGGDRFSKLGVSAGGVIREGAMVILQESRQVTSIAAALFTDDAYRLIVETHALEPAYLFGDVVLGRPIEGQYFHNLIGRDAIVATKDGHIFLGKLLRSGHSGRYIISPADPNAPPLDTHIKWAAPVEAIIRNPT